ncbi:MAG: metallophosphoesterase [Steroidobacteraceae bacterium]
MATTRPVRLLQVTDPHLSGDPEREIYDVRTAESLRRVLAEALGGGATPPDAILVTGDIGDDESEQAYRNFRGMLQGFGVPVLCLPGNHDAPRLMAQLLEGGGFQYCGRAGFGDWGIILLDTHLPYDPSGYLAAPELARLDADLHAFADSHVLVCLHHPPVPVGSAWLDGLGLRNHREFRAVIDRHPQVRAVLAGHVHQAFDQQHGRVRFLTTPSTCAQFTPQTVNCVMDMRPPGYRWLSLLPDGGIDTEVMWLRDWEPRARPSDSRGGGMGP